MYYLNPNCKSCSMPHPDGDKHHYIPKFYLKQWTGADRKLSVFFKPYRQVEHRRKYPDETGYVRGLNTLTELPPIARNFLETEFLKYADNQAYAALCALLDERSDIHTELKSAWSRFLMTMLHRSPEGIASLKERISKTFLKKLAENLGFNVDVSEAELHKVYARVLYGVMDSEQIGQILNSMIWGVAAPRFQSHPLMTSDRPIMMTNGLRGDFGHLIIPIAPDRVFVAATKETTINFLVGQKGFGRHINDRVVRQARRYVYAQDDKQFNFVAKRFGERARWSPWE